MTFQIKKETDLLNYKDQIRLLDSTGSTTVSGSLFQQVSITPQFTNLSTPTTVSKRESNSKSYFRIVYLVADSGKAALAEKVLYFALLPAVESFVAKGLTPGIMPGVYTYVDKSVKSFSTLQPFAIYQSLGTSNRCLDIAGLLIPQAKLESIDSASSSWLGGSALGTLDNYSVVEGVDTSSTWSVDSASMAQRLMDSIINEPLPCRIDIIPSESEDFSNRANQGVSLIGIPKSIKLFGMRESRFYYNMKFILLGNSLTFQESGAWTNLKNLITESMKTPPAKTIHTPAKPQVQSNAPPPDSQSSITDQSAIGELLSPSAQAATLPSPPEIPISTTSGVLGKPLVSNSVTLIRQVATGVDEIQKGEVLSPASTLVGAGYNAVVTVIKFTSGERVVYYPSVEYTLTDKPNQKLTNYKLEGDNLRLSNLTNANVPVTEYDSTLNLINGIEAELEKIVQTSP